MPGALDHLLVLDLTSHLSGPYCAMMLADHGADVIKIEPPTGDSARNMPPFVNGESAPFMTWNRNKRSVVMDFKKQADRMAFLQMVDRADVVVENYRPGVMDRLGIGWDVLHAAQSTPDSGVDLGVRPDRPVQQPRRVRSDHPGDVGTDEHQRPRRRPAASPADRDLRRDRRHVPRVRRLTALEARHRTGEGQRVETSLFEAATSLAVYESAHYFATGTRPERIGQAHRGSAPYQCFQTADGYITLGASQQKFFEGLCGAGRHAVTDRG